MTLLPTDPGIPLQILATTFPGLEAACAEEIAELGGADVRSEPALVRFSGTRAFLCFCCLQLRTALRLLVEVRRAPVRKPDDLYRAIRELPWTSALTPEQSLAVDVSGGHAEFRHPRYAAQVVKDAVVDRIRSDLGARPSVDLEEPTLRIHLHLGPTAVLALDAVGSSLHRRGYRRHQSAAPLNEVVAAALLRLSGWDRRRPLVDPMCGSGTIGIEAALWANGIAPGLLREHFAFEKWVGHDPELWSRLRREAEARVQPQRDLVRCADVDDAAVQMTEANLRLAGVVDTISVVQSDFAVLESGASPGHLVMNPPYGVRLDDGDIGPLYRNIGDRLKQAWSGHDAWVLSGNLPALKCVGLRSARRITLHNGGIESRFVHFPLYSGSGVQRPTPNSSTG